MRSHKTNVRVDNLGYIWTINSLEKKSWYVMILKMKCSFWNIAVFNPFWHICELQLKLERAGKHAVWERMGVNLWLLYHWHQQTLEPSRTKPVLYTSLLYTQMMARSPLTSANKTQALAKKQKAMHDTQRSANLQNTVHAWSVWRCLAVKPQV